MGIEDRLRASWKWLTGTGVDVATGVLGAPQRAVGGAAYGIEHHKQFPAILRQVWHDATSVDLATQVRDTESIRAAVHAPTHAQIDAFVKTHVPKDMQPYATGILKGGEDILLQTLSDPLTYVGGIGVWAKGVKGALKGAATVRMFLDTAAKYGMEKQFPGLKLAAQAYEDAMKTYGEWFHIRPELDYLGPEGKRAYMQIEKQVKETTGQLRVNPQNVTDDEAARKLYLQMVYEHGSPMASKAAAQRIAGEAVKVTRGNSKATGFLRMGDENHVSAGLDNFMASTPQERAAELNRMADQIEKSKTASAAEQYFKAHPESLPKGTQQINWAKMPQHKNPFGGRQGQEMIEDATSWFRKLSQASVYLNPFPHGLANVGQLMFLAGGPGVVPEALRYMTYATARGAGKLARVPGAAKIGAAYDKDVQRLRTGGAIPDYTHGLLTSFWSKLPGWKEIGGPMQTALEHMEIGWRVARLRQLDRALGPSKTARDELLKMRSVEEAVGDYENQNAFVEMLKAMGGPWVAFHMGIVPRALLKAIEEHPERALLLARIQDAAQNSRSKTGQTNSMLNLPGSPLRAITNPIKYGSGPASFGLIEAYKKFGESLEYESVPRALAQQASRLNPFGEWIRLAVDAATGAGMPAPNTHGSHFNVQHPQTMTDRLVTAMLEVLGGYYSKQKSAAAKKAQVREEKSKERYRKVGDKAPWWALFQ